MDLSQPQLIKLNSIIVKGLYEVRSFKDNAVSSEKYENSTQFRVLK